MKRLFLYGVALLVPPLVASCPAEAGLLVSGVVGGSSTGAIQESFDSLFPGNEATTTLPSGLTLSYDGDAGPVSGSIPNIEAAPFLSGGNGLGFGPSGSTQANGVDGTTYITAGQDGSVTLRFPTLETYLGILWGSVDGYNSLNFYNGATLIGTVTGSDVLASPNGDQGINGTAYVNIGATGGSAFDRVVVTSGLNAFEFDDISFNVTLSTLAADPLPEPTGLGLFGIGLLGLGFVRRRGHHEGV
jgi:hypothetical protein